MFLSVYFIRKIFFVCAAAVALLASSFSWSAQSGDAVIFSKRFDLTQSKAYQIQKAYVKNAVAKGASELGYKAGLTNNQAQAKFGMAEPISGVLLQPPARGGLDRSTFELKDSHQLMIELELVFKLKANISKPIKLEELQRYISGFAPAIELPDMSFKEKGFTGYDIIANNALAYEFIVGEFVQDLSTVNNISVSLFCEGEQIATGLSNKAMGDQKHALLWLINHLVDLGYSLRKGQVLLTGSLIPMQTAKPCQYVAQFSGLSDIQFTVQ